MLSIRTVYLYYTDRPDKARGAARLCMNVSTYKHLYPISTYIDKVVLTNYKDKASEADRG